MQNFKYAVASIRRRNIDHAIEIGGVELFLPPAEDGREQRCSQCAENSGEPSFRPILVHPSFPNPIVDHHDRIEHRLGGRSARPAGQVGISRLVENEKGVIVPSENTLQIVKGIVPRLAKSARRSASAPLAFQPQTEETLMAVEDFPVPGSATS